MTDDIIQSLYSSLINYVFLILTITHVTLSMDRFLHLFCRFWLPKREYPQMHDAMSSKTDDRAYPLVAIQLPVMNEIQCFESLIDCACHLNWPKNRLIVQVLDDSTEDIAKILIDTCVKRRINKGIQIQVYRRGNRQGFKAGNLKFGMEFIKEVDYIAIFDADFLPEPDFLERTIPSLMCDPKVAFVQACWTFTNAKESFLTRIQEMCLNFHHRCEQESRYRASLFFTFNGTGGVWRRSAIEDIGGWHTDTVIEDLDLSIRAHVYGWRSIYIEDVRCLSELPPTQSAYFSQQYRWSCGRMQVGRKMILDICRSTHITWYQKMYAIWYIIRSWAHTTTFIFLTIIIPMKISTSSQGPYNHIAMLWSFISNIGYMLFTLDEVHLIFPYVLFTNAMALHNTFALVAGFFNYGKAKEWVVTPKFGTVIEKSFGSELKRIGSDTSISSKRIYHQLLRLLSILTRSSQWFCRTVSRKLRLRRLHKSYLVVGIYLLFISCVAHQKGMYIDTIYLFSTAIMHLIMALDCMGRSH